MTYDAGNLDVGLTQITNIKRSSSAHVEIFWNNRHMVRQKSKIGKENNLKGIRYEINTFNIKQLSPFYFNKTIIVLPI